MIKKGILLTLCGLVGVMSIMAQSDNKIVIDKDIQLIPLQDSIYVHLTWHHHDDFGRFPSNGLIVIRGGQALMIDTPVDNDKTGRLTRYLKDSMSVAVTKLIIGHFHDDCMGGLEYLQSIGVESIANSMTIEICRETGLPVPSTPFSDTMTFDFNGEPIHCRYFGAGHSSDNITVWLPKRKILFGGCLVKSVDSRGLGNLSDAVVADWDFTIHRIIQEYPVIKTVIPGHGDFGGPELLTHTIILVENEKSR